MRTLLPLFACDWLPEDVFSGIAFPLSSMRPDHSRVARPQSPWLTLARRRFAVRTLPSLPASRSSLFPTGSSYAQSCFLFLRSCFLLSIPLQLAFCSLPCRYSAMRAWLPFDLHLRLAFDLLWHRFFYQVLSFRQSLCPSHAFPSCFFCPSLACSRLLTSLFSERFPSCLDAVTCSLIIFLAPPCSSSLLAPRVLPPLSFASLDVSLNASALFLPSIAA